MADTPQAPTATEEIIGPHAKKMHYPNGSYELYICDSMSEVVAPNPFGGTWTQPVHTSSTNALYQARSYGTTHITRRKKKWVLHMTPEGWTFIEMHGE